MNILAVETTGKYASVCLIHDAKSAFKKNENEMEHLATILDMARELLADCKLSIDDIDALAVSVGPGSFTGMRIGTAFVRCISQAKNIRCIAIDTLEAFTFSSGFERSSAMFCAPMLDARRGQVYAAFYEKAEDAFCKEVVNTDVYMMQDFLDKLREMLLLENDKKEIRIFFTGNACEKYKKELQNWSQSLSQIGNTNFIACFEKNGEFEQSAVNVGAMARKMYEAGSFTDYSEILPKYLRKSEAERKLDKEKQQELESATDKINI
ncbi:MAG: tRNA (adenosine(37)-N6)-threonylcarbamoyltransferase complex dimerization subunit type 1 TsaB [Eubacteriales bacterium]